MLTVLVLTSACGSSEDSDRSASGLPQDTSSDTSSATTEPDAEPPDLDLSGVRLRVGVVGANGPVREEVYRRSGAFDDAPYSVEWVDFDGANSLIEALNAGAIDAGVSVQSPVVVLSSGNASTPWTAESAPFRVVGAVTPVEDPGMSIVVRASSDIDSIEDLAGRKVTYPPGTMFHYFYLLVAAEAGLEPGVVEEVRMPAGEGRAAFMSGAVDAMLSGPRASAPLISSGEGRLLMSSLGVVTPYRLHLVRAGLLDDPARAAAVRDLLERVEDAEAWSAANIDEVAEIYEREAAMSEAEARDAALTAPMRRIPVDDLVRGVLLDQIELFRENEVIQTDIDLDALIDDRYDEGAASP